MTCVGCGFQVPVHAPGAYTCGCGITFTVTGTTVQAKGVSVGFSGVVGGLAAPQECKQECRSCRMAEIERDVARRVARYLLTTPLSEGEIVELEQKHYWLAE